jgi:hypothetical protein
MIRPREITRAARVTGIGCRLHSCIVEFAARIVGNVAREHGGGGIARGCEAEEVMGWRFSGGRARAAVMRSAGTV